MNYYTWNSTYVLPLNTGNTGLGSSLVFIPCGGG